MLRFFASQVCVCVWKKEDAAIEKDDSALAPHVTWQSRMPWWMHVSRAHPLSRLESWSDRDVTPRRGAPVDHRGNRLRREQRGLSSRAGRRTPSLELGLLDGARGDHRRRQPGEPLLVIRHPEVLDGGQDLEAMAKRIEVPQTAPGSQYARERVHPSLPALVECGLVGLVPNRPH